VVVLGRLLDHGFPLVLSLQRGKKKKKKKRNKKNVSSYHHAKLGAVENAISINVLSSRVLGREKESGKLKGQKTKKKKRKKKKSQLTTSL
jgi:hypothetical protein